MKRTLIALGAGATVIFGAVGVWLPSKTEPKTESEVIGEAAGAVQGPRFLALLDKWSVSHEAQGGDRNIEISLRGAGPTPGHEAVEQSAEAGLARIDAIDGKVDVQVASLPSDKSYDVWLVDQRPTSGSSSEIEATDAFIKAGTLQARADALGLEADLGAAAFTSFQVDAVVVTEAGRTPNEQALLKGTTDLFQTVYTATRTPELFAASDFVSPSAFPSSGRPLIGENSAFAQATGTADPLKDLRNFGTDQMERRQLVNVNRAVVTNQMVAMGAKLFITETFNGNGRTCETCHNFLDNVTLSLNDVQLRPDRDALFVSEFMQAFAPRMVNGQMRFMQDNPVAVRTSARMGVFEDGLDQQPLSRAVPHLQALVTSREPVAPAIARQVPANAQVPAAQAAAAAGTRFGTFFPGGPAVAPAAGTMMGPINSRIRGDAANRVGPAADNTFSIGLRQGWGGDLGIEPSLGLFGDDTGTVVGAVATLLSSSPMRRPGMDFRVPTPAEIQAITAFYLTIGRQQNIDLAAFRLTDPGADRGRQIFTNDGQMAVRDAQGQPVAAGKCNTCHFNMSSRTNPVEFSALCQQIAAGGRLDLDGDGQRAPQDRDDNPACARVNFDFATGVENNTDIADSMSRQMFNIPVQADGGFGRILQVAQACRGGRPGARGAVAAFAIPNTQIMQGDCQELFNPPVLVEAADTGPFFHDNTATTIEEAIGFYNTQVFGQSPGGRILAAVTPTPVAGRPINLNVGDIQQLARFFRAMNAQNNVRLAIDLLQGAQTNGVSTQAVQQLSRVARAEVQDAINDLDQGQINAKVMVQLMSIRTTLDTQVQSPMPNATGGIVSRLQDALNGIVRIQGNPNGPNA